MSGPMLKNCFNCRIALPENAVNTSQCAKCQKNEEKYGKPGTCQHCKLNAAFHDQKCVWCSHAERKFGSPFPCAYCKLPCAFPRHDRDKEEGASLLCRLCILQARHTRQTVLAGIPVPPEKPEKSSSGSSSEQRNRHHHHHRHNRDREPGTSTSHHHRHGQKRRHADAGSSVPPLLPSNNENGNSTGLPPFDQRDQGESMVKQQKMEDEIRRLKTLIQDKDQMIFEKDKQISSLKADQYNLEKKHRERVQQLIKEKEESIRAIEHMRNSKHSKKN